jgi:hypothetical protein
MGPQIFLTILLKNISASRNYLDYHTEQLLILVLPISDNLSDVHKFPVCNSVLWQKSAKIIRRDEAELIKSSCCSCLCPRQRQILLRQKEEVGD